MPHTATAGDDTLLWVGYPAGSIGAGLKLANICITSCFNQLVFCAPPATCGVFHPQQSAFPDAACAILPYKLEFSLGLPRLELGTYRL